MGTLLKILFALIAIPAWAYAPANPDDRRLAEFFSKQCPGCTQTNLQFFNNQKRLALAQTKITLKPGFYTADQAEIPAKVRVAGRSVFSLIVLNENEGVYPEFFTHVLLEKSREWAKSEKSHTRRVAQVALAYHEKCHAENQPLCRAPLPQGAIAGGSAVLIGEGGTELWTAGHVFEEPFRQALARAGTKDVQALVKAKTAFKVLIFDSEDRLVAHPFNNKLRLAFSASPNVIERLNPVIGIDNIRFDLERSLGRGLEVAAEIRDGGNIYSVGYPACTGCTDSYGSVGEALVSGTRFPHRDATAFDHQFTLGQVLASDGQMIVTNADGHGGMSGGAALDEEGRVVGINSAVGVSMKAPDFLADRRLKLSRPASWGAFAQIKRRA